jgi:hypothetical protein
LSAQRIRVISTTKVHECAENNAVRNKETIMTKKLALIGLGAFILLSAGGSAVMAGLKATQVVSIGGNTAVGSMGDARNSADGTQYIGCIAGYGYISCIAKNSAGLVKSCFTQDPVMVGVAGNLSGATELSFSFDANGSCTDVSTYNFSYYRPMTP